MHGLPWIAALTATCIALPAVCAAAEGGLAGPVAPPRPLVETAPDQLVAMLDSPDPHLREDATTALMLHDEISDAQLSDWLRQSRSPEQRHRLILTAMHRYFATLDPVVAVPIADHGAMGIDTPDDRIIVHPPQHPLLHHPAVLVTETRPGFPAFALLRPGDLILGMQGVRFDQTLSKESFVRNIQRFAPYEVVRLEVLRGDRRLQIQMQLDSLNRLQDVVTRQLHQGDPALYPPWQEHLRTLMGEEAPSEAPILLEPRHNTSRPAEG